MAELVSIKRNVDVSPGQAAPAVFHCSQGDVGSKIILGLLNNGTAYAIPSGVTVTIEGSESNGSIFTPISATASGSDITFYLTGEMTAVAGPAICQAVLKSGSNILGTANFTLEVESSPMGADAPPVFTDAGWTWMLNKLTTEFVPALGDNIIDAIDSKADQSDLTALSNAKLDKNQGTANAGKYLKVGANGDVETADLDVTTDKTLSIADKAADAKAVGNELTDLKSAINSITYGIDITPSYTVGANNKFSILLVEGQTYTVKNNTTVGSNVVLVRNDNTTKVVTGNLASGASISFVADEDDYVAVQMFINPGATGTVNISAEISVYDRIGVLEADNEKNTSDILRLYNSFNDLLYGATYSFTGTLSSINKFNMPLFDGLKYTATNNTGAAIGIDLYKADGTSKQISSSLANGASIEFTVDSKDYTQIGGWFNAGSTGTLSVTCDFSFIEDVAEIRDDVASNAEEIENINAEIGKIATTSNIDVTSQLTPHENQFYNINNAIYAGGGQWNYYTFAVKPGDIFDIDTVAGETVRAWAFRDANENQLSIESYSGGVVQKTYTDVVAPANATELIVNFKHISGTMTVIMHNVPVVDAKSVVYKGQQLPTYLDKINTSSNILYGKVLCCCGDSITYGADMTGNELITPAIESYQYSAYTKKWTRWTAEEPATYGYQIAARNGMIFYNGGVSGACVQGSGGTSTVPGFSVTDGEYTLLPEDIDYLTLFFGWNDTAYGSLGTINDTTNDSYYGAYNVVLPYLINKYPYTKITLIVPFGTDVGHRQAIRELANKWGLACFDMYREGAPLYWGKEPDIDVDSSVVTANRTKFSAQANSPHPNIHGHYQIGTMLEQFLRGI